MLFRSSNLYDIVPGSPAWQDLDTKDRLKIYSRYASYPELTGIGKSLKYDTKTGRFSDPGYNEGEGPHGDIVANLNSINTQRPDTTISIPSGTPGIVGGSIRPRDPNKESAEDFKIRMADMQQANRVEASKAEQEIHDADQKEKLATRIMYHETIQHHDYR